MPFKFVRDPLFLGATALFLLNVCFLKRALPHNSFFHSYLTDLLCLPVWVPIMLWVMRCLKWRDDRPPQPLEILLPWIFWSVMFEVVLPHANFFEHFAPGDPLDILTYGIGGILGFAFWKAWYRPARTLKLRA